MGLAEALGWPDEVKQLAFNRWRELPNMMLGARLASVKRCQSSALVAASPDLVLGAARRSVPAAW